MKKYIFAFLPLMGLNAQVTIGDTSGNNTSAMLNITKQNSVFIIPVAEANLTDELTRDEAVTIAPEGSMIYLRDSSSSDSGIHFRVAGVSNSLTGSSSNLKWSPFRKNNRTYIYNNVKKVISEQMLGYSSENFPNQLLPYNCFRWEVENSNNPSPQNPQGNGHVYCLVENATYGAIPKPNSNSNEYLCSTTQEIASNPTSLPFSNQIDYDISGVTVNTGSRVRTGLWFYVYYREYTIRGNWATNQITAHNSTQYTRQANELDWKCAFATAQKDKGYLATITSNEEYQTILTGLSNIVTLNPDLEVNNIAIGLRNIINNEGDRTTYQPISTNPNIVRRKKVWVNGEQNAVNWLSLTTNVSLPLGTNTQTIDTNPTASSLNHKKRTEIKTTKSIVRYTTNNNEIKIRIRCSLLGGDNTCNKPAAEVLKLMDEWSYQNSNRVTKSAPVIDISTRVSSYEGSDSKDCGGIRYDSTTNKLILDDCDITTFNHILVEYNN